MSGLYIHIPFCKQACSYCDFYFVTAKTDHAPFIGALCEEIRSYRDSPYAQEPVQTLYIGGGTPSRLRIESLETVLRTVLDTFPSDGIGEITIEMNPDDVHEEYIEALIDLGVTRVSMGVQTFDPELLRFMHRAHSRDDALRSLELLSTSSLPTYSADLIYGNPGQKKEILQNDLDMLTAFKPPHISAYALTIEPRTRLGKLLDLGRLIPAPDDEVGEQMNLIRTHLKAHGIEQYEVSNYARPGHESRHNSAYWRHINYLGMGPAAHSFWWDERGRGARRWQNVADLRSYINSPSSVRTARETLGLNSLAEERIMISLRTIEGIDLRELAERYEYTFSEKQSGYVAKLEQSGLVHRKDSVVMPTSEGLKVADRITLDLITRRTATTHIN